MEVIRMRDAQKVRKQFLLDENKLRLVRSMVEAKTDTEAVNKAMDMVIAAGRIAEALESVKGKGKIRDVYGRVAG